MQWLLFFLAMAYVVPVVPTWCLLYLGSRARRGKPLAWVLASLGAVLWLPLLAWVYLGVRMTTTKDHRAWARRRVADDQVIARLESSLYPESP